MHRVSVQFFRVSLYLEDGYIGYKPTKRVASRIGRLELHSQVHGTMPLNYIMIPTLSHLQQSTKLNREEDILKYC